ncbi:MAG: hypothetical protein OEX77_04465 [Candidatus Bathyarchaeota archaeon]|nr:hypothetical protein [Candidatus Bathyarchaeota archaeon]
MKKTLKILLLMISLTICLGMSSIPLVYACHAEVYVEKSCLTHGYDSDSGEDSGIFEATASKSVGCKTLGSTDTYAYAYAQDNWPKKDKLKVKVECHLPGTYARAKAETDKEKEKATGPTALYLSDDIVIVQIGLGWANYSIDAYDVTADISLFSAVATFEDEVFSVTGDWLIGDWLVEGTSARFPAGTFAIVPNDHEYTCAHTCEAYASDGTAEARSLLVEVGGVWIPSDKFGLLVPYIGVASTIVAGTVAAAIYMKRRKKHQ